MVLREQNGEAASILEFAPLVTVDPVELVRNNLASLVVNQARYRSFVEGGFSPALLDPPLVARVLIPSGGVDEGTTRLLIVDGMTRAKYIADHIGQRLPGYVNFDFSRLTVRDGTEALLRDSLICPEGIFAGQNGLTMVQYLRAVLPVTVEHEKIADQRIAAHLINAWRVLVGLDINEKFSAIAALSLLSQGYYTFNAVDLHAALSSKDQFFTGESVEERRVTIEALATVAKVIQEAQLAPWKVAEAAFMLVGDAGEIVGGEAESRKQVYGLLKAHKIDEKLIKAFKSKGRMEAAREKLAEAVLRIYRTLSAHSDRQQVLVDVHAALEHPDLSYEQTLLILKDRDPSAAYRSAVEDTNAMKLEMFYRQTFDKLGAPLSELEARFFSVMGGQERFDPNGMVTMVRVIHEASTFIESEVRPHFASLKMKVKGRDAQATREMLQEKERVLIEGLVHYQPAVVTKRLRALKEVMGRRRGVGETLATQMKMGDTEAARGKSASKKTPQNGRRLRNSSDPDDIPVFSGEAQPSNDRLADEIEYFHQLLDEEHFSRETISAINKERVQELIRRLGRLISDQPG
ncbi:MAG: hypothetical protein HYS86_01180 [Candidatus Chisholmbacteria bacterium]|nr:hypothetical protein [Candidatus Chisholmbacteria bacterium]